MINALKSIVSTSNMGKRVCHSCKEDIKKDDAIYECDGPCQFVIHERCSALKGARTVNTSVKMYKNLCFRCDDCIENDGYESNLLAQFRKELDERDQKHSLRFDEMMAKMAAIEDLLKSNVKKDVKSYASVTRREHVVVVRPKEIEQKRADVRKAITNIIDPTEFDTNGLANAGGNSLVIRCNSSETQEKIIDKLSSADGITAAKPKSSRPRIKILRMLDPEEDDTKLIEKLKLQNDIELTDAIVLKREKVFRNGAPIDERKNIVMEINSEDYNKVMKMKKIKHEWEICKVVDNVFVRRCYNCFGFNHNAKDCKNKKACPRCAKSHESKECNAETVKCINCITSRDKFKKKDVDVNHEAWSRECPVYKSKVESGKRIASRMK
jgi:hypothetical protein